MIAAGRRLRQSHIERVADAKSGLSAGDTIRLGRDPFRVVGLVEDTINSGGEPALVITLRSRSIRPRRQGGGAAGSSGSG
ncbi:ABC transporter permease [Roseovarius dicentrarchi]|uniref:ABC transporter permease n=1 Tax=Roseovarius dicentrarchi TaxID=2250573 RepID=UPI00193AB674|nr:ABC transporter permease [Roseovarius dicentrarchi]